MARVSKNQTSTGNVSADQYCFSTDDKTSLLSAWENGKAPSKALMTLLRTCLWAVCEKTNDNNIISAKINSHLQSDHLLDETWELLVEWAQGLGIENYYDLEFFLTQGRIPSKGEVKIPSIKVPKLPKDEFIQPASISIVPSKRQSTAYFQLDEILQEYEHNIGEWEQAIYRFKITGCDSKEESYCNTVFRYSVQKHRVNVLKIKQELKFLQNKQKDDATFNNLKIKLEESLRELKELKEKGVSPLLEKAGKFWQQRDVILKEFKELLSADLDTRVRVEDKIRTSMIKLMINKINTKGSWRLGWERVTDPKLCLLNSYYEDTLLGHNPSAHLSAQKIITELQSFLSPTDQVHKDSEKYYKTLIQIADFLSLPYERYIINGFNEYSTNLFSPRLNTLIQNIYRVGEKVFIETCSKDKTRQLLEWQEETQNFELRINFGTVEDHLFTLLNLENYFAYNEGRETVIYNTETNDSFRVPGIPHEITDYCGEKITRPDGGTNYITHDLDFTILLTHSGPVPKKKYGITYFWNLICIDKKNDDFFIVENFKLPEEWSQPCHPHLSEIKSGISKHDFGYEIDIEYGDDFETLKQKALRLESHPKKGYIATSLLNATSVTSKAMQINRRGAYMRPAIARRAS